MAPSNPSSLSDGRISGGEYRRRSAAHHAVASHPSSNAIAAAEAAASYILSDGPIITKKSIIRNRSSSGISPASNGGGGVVANGNSKSNINGSNNCASNGNNSNNNGSFLLRMHGQRERLMRRQRQIACDTNASSLKTTAWILLFGLVGIIFLFEGEHIRQHKRNNNSAVGNGSDSQARVMSVPLPPSVERKHEKERLVSQLRGNRHKEHGNAVDKSGETQSAEYDAAIPKAASSKAEEDNDARGTTTSRHHDHAIPPVLIFTYHTDLLATPESDLSDEEDVALARNVRDIVSLHPDASVRFLDDEACVESIRFALGRNTTLAGHFARESRGMYKADICRGAALYETGGLYFDVDIEARMPLWDAIAPGTGFVTTLVHKDSNHHGGFFQAFIGATARHPVMRRYLELFVRHYEGDLEVKGPLGVYLLRMAYDDVGERDAEAYDLWHEVRYHPKLFPTVKRDHWGERRACQMLVVAPEKETSGSRGKYKRERMVPLFSHANGSRMCGGKDTHKKGGTN